MKSANARPRVLPFIPAVSEPIQGNTEGVVPYTPRIARALVVLFSAVSMHIWAVASPHPQQMPVAAFAARMMRLPGIPLAPPLPPAASHFSVVSKRRITVESTLVRVPPLPARTILPRTLRAEQIAVPVGTSGRFLQASAPEPSSAPGRLPAAPLVKSSDVAVVPASAPEPSGRPPLPGDPSHHDFGAAATGTGGPVP